MGIDLVKLAFRNTAGLSPAAIVVLTYMASVALDKPNGKGQPARLYFGGWGPLAQALGYEVDPDERLPNAARLAVKRALRELRAAELVTSLIPRANVHTGERQVYRLDLPEGVTTDPQVGNKARDDRGSPQTPRGGHHRPPGGGHP